MWKRQIISALLTITNIHHQFKLKPYITLKPYHHRPYTTAMSSVEESDVGILCYISDLPGFSGILKQRYSDFIVNEVDLDGNVVHLTALEPPEEIADEKKVNAADVVDKDYTAEFESFRSLAGDSNWEMLKNFVDKNGSLVNKDEEFIVLSSSSDKTYRTAIHNFFKERLKFLVTDTVDGSDSLSKCIRVRYNSGNSNGTGRNSRKRKDRAGKPYDARGSDSWPQHIGKFLRFNLYKENKDTQEALGLLGRFLGAQPKSFGFAGTKDKRSVSTQRVTVFKQRASKVAALNERLIGIKVGNFCHVNEGLVLGQLQGNRFTITLRSVTAESEEIVSASATALGKNGFINYFGLQRFGSSSIPTHQIGAALLRGEWKAAVSMILDPREGAQRDAIRNVREYYKESGDIEGTLRQLPRYLVAECAILHSFQKCPGNYLQALSAIPRTLRMMFVHSYQSYLWNHAASMRVQKYGIHQVVLGDLVYSKEQDIVNEVRSSDVDFEDGSCNDSHIDCLLDDITETDLSEVGKKAVKVIDEEDLIGGKYTTEDIVLPLPGSKIIYPLNDIGKVYHDLAEQDAISLTDSTHNSKEFSLTNMTGAYRRVFQKPKDFEWELLKYTDCNKPLVETDWEILSKTHPATSGRYSNNKEQFKLQACARQEVDKSTKEIELSTGNNETEHKEENTQIEESQNVCGDQKSQLALKLSFTLPSSCYATMAIRELLKTSTSVAFHKTLS